MKFPEVDGIDFYLCGGAVRDLHLGKEAKDLDFVMITKMSYDEIVNKINQIGKVFLAKPEFFTIRCKLDDEIYDLVLPRGDGYYEDSRHPSEVTRLNNLKDDAKRRDFTMNALYMDKDGYIIDSLNGVSAIKNKVILTCGKPAHRFSEDPLRILRAIRFSIQLGFKIDKNCSDMMITLAPFLKKISIDRIREEINKMLLIDPYETINLLEDYYLLSIVKEKGLKFQITNKVRLL